jgi:hypothetical protein
MNNRTIGIIVTVVAALLFGCPGLISLCLGITAAIVGLSGDPDYYFGIDTEPNSTLLGGLIFICLSVVLIAIPVVIGFLLVRRKTQPESDEVLVIDAEAREPSESESPAAQEKPEELEDDIPPAI